MMMIQCAEHVDSQLPNELTRVNFLLNYIEFKDSGLKEAILMAKGNKGPTRKMNTSKDAAAYITP